MSIFREKGARRALQAGLGLALAAALAFVNGCMSPDPAGDPESFEDESVGAAVLYTTAFVWHAPVSTTHIITSAIMGSGATKRLSAVRWGVAGNILTAWVLTFPAAGLFAAIVYWIFRLVFRLP